MMRYLLFATVATALFMAVYWLLRRDRWLQLSRWFLLGTLALSLVLPAFRFTVPVSVAEGLGMGGLMLTEVSSETSGGVVEVVEVPVDEGVERAEMPIWAFVYLGGVAVMVVVLGVRWVRMWLRLRKFVFERREGFRLALTDDDTPAFSFINYIVIGRRGYSEEELRLILAHERTHVGQHHTAEMLFVQLVKCVLWFDPFVWLYEQELRQVHEYLADDAVLRQSDRTEYLRLLFHQTTGVGYCAISNNFSFSPLKNRITMMTQKKSRFGAAKVLLALPVAALLLFVNCKTSIDIPDHFMIEDGTYELAGGMVDTYKDGQLVQRVIGSVEVPLEEVGDHMVLSSQKEAKEFSKGLGAKVVHTFGMYKQGGHGFPQYFDVYWASDTSIWMKDDVSDLVVEAQFDCNGKSLPEVMVGALKYPESAKKDGVEGTVVVRFAVEKDGSVKDVEVIRGLREDCDQAALECVMNTIAPYWHPATFNGKPARSIFYLPIQFRMK